MKMKPFIVVTLIMLTCSYVYGQNDKFSQNGVNTMDTIFSVQAIAMAQKTVDAIVKKVETSLSYKNKPFRLVIRLAAKPGYIDKVLASYKGQQVLAAQNSGSVIYHVSLDANDGSILLYEAWKDFPSFEKHERHSITLKHFARTSDWLEKERIVQVVKDAFL